MLIQGIIIIIASLIWAWAAKCFVRVPNPKTTTGEIVALRQERKDDHDDHIPLFSAWVQYDVDGKKYTTKHHSRSSSFRVGQKYRVVYDETNPEHAVIRPKMPTYFIPFGLATAGLYLIIVQIIQI